MKRFTSILLTLAMMVTLLPMNIFAAENTTFFDVTGSEYYADSAEALAKLNILAGYEDGTFGAEKSITRAEMAAIVCRMLGMEKDAEDEKGKTNFDDVSSNHWASGYINIANAEKIINGDGDGNFRPEDDVKYEEAIKMVVCTLGFGDGITVNPQDWSKAYIEIAAQKGITKNLKGIKGQAATRGDIAVMCHNGLIIDLAAPVASVKEGSYTGTQKVKLTTTTEGADIYYTTDGSTPTVKSTKYTKEISISKTSTLKAVTVKSGVLVSDVMSVAYTIKKLSGGGGGSSRNVTYTLSFSESVNGVVDTSVSGSYSANKSIALSATPQDGYVFSKWVSNNGGTFENINNATTTFIMPANDVTIGAEFIAVDKDEDLDGVSSQVESLFGTDNTNIDSDGDGLSDYIEIYISETDPLMIDTDGNGISDGDEDLDGDGLTNIQEVELGTNLAKTDSDLDGLSDYDEVNIYKTNPCCFDSDGDGVPDGDEILLGLNPLSDKSDGITLDSERKFNQDLNNENIADELLLDDNAAIPSLNANAFGNINRYVSIDKTHSNDFSDSRAIVGEAIDIAGDNIESGVLTFALNDDNIALLSVEDTNEEFNTNLICKYNDDGSTDYLETSYDATSNTISANIDGDGTYFVLNVKNLFDELGLAMPSVSNLETLSDSETISLMSIDDEDFQTNDNNQQSLEATSVSVSENSESLNVAIASAETNKITLASAGKSSVSGAMAQADIVFIIDTTGSMSDEISNVKNNINAFVDTLKSKGVSAGLALVEYRDIAEDGYDSTRVHKNGASNWFYDMDAYKNKISSALSADGGGDTPECVIDALETARLLDMRASAGKIFILVTDANYKIDNRYNIPSMAAEIELLKNAGVSCSVVSDSSDQYTYYDLYTETNGIWANIYGDFNSELRTLADRIGDEIVGDGYWIYLQGPVPVPVRLDEMPTPDSKADTDHDGILDKDELESTTPTGEINLDELVSKISKGAITGTDYGIVKMYKYKSNPTEIDTDFDGLEDSVDPMPKSNSFKGVMHYKLDKKDRTCNIDFNMDYRNLIIGNNKTYSRDLSKLAILYASDVYDDLYIELKEGANGGDDNPTTFGKLLGLNDTKCYKINSSDYSTDKDDITEFFVGHKNILYNGNTQEVIVVSVRGTNGTNEEWSSNFDVGADTTEYYNATGEHPDWINKNNHKGFDVSANRVLKTLLTYISNYTSAESQKNILITGHSRGAAIANILGAYFEDEPNYRAYTYTFATPNSTTAYNADSYSTIFNIKNSDDIIPLLPISEWNFKNYGVTKSISVEKNYEKKWFAAEEGTWEWFIGVDYNNDGGTLRTLSAFAKIANCREDLYKLDTSSDGKVWENNLGHVTRAGAEEELNSLRTTLENEKLLRFCNIYVVGGGISYHVEVNYCPAYLMQSLCNMTTGNGPMLGHDVKGKYAKAKASFVASSGKVVVGGMEHPHMQPTYYIIAHNDFKALK